MIRPSKRNETLLTACPQCESATALESWESGPEDRVPVREREPGLSAEIVVVRSANADGALVCPPNDRIKSDGIARRTLRREPERLQRARGSRASKACLNGVQYDCRGVRSSAH